MIKGLLLSLPVAACLAVNAFGQTVVIPNANASVAGNASGGLPSSPVSAEIQTLFDPSQFPAEPIYITGFSIRPAPGMGPLSVTIGGNLYLSTSPNWPSMNNGHTLMSATFANNVGPDNTLVLSPSNITLTSAGCAGPAPCPFTNALVFTTPFLYNPANGPLLFDLKATSFGGSGPSDKVACNAPGCSIASVSGTPLGGGTGSFGYGGSIAQFTYAPASSTTTYRYTGNALNDCNGVSAVNGNCPANYTADYVTASVTFLAPLGPNLSGANQLNSPNLVSWTLGDAFGNVAFSSTDANAAEELSVLSFSTNAAGVITGWSVAAKTANYQNGQSGNGQLGAYNPTLINGTTGLPQADYVIANGGSSGPTGWHNSDSIPGTWTAPGTGTQTSPVVTYRYTGSPFTGCSYGTCPANYTSDYIAASLTFSAALPPNLPLTNELSSPNLVAWTVGDALGYFSYSSADTNAATELPTLSLSTDGNGNIVNYTMLAGAGPPYTGGAVNPTLTDKQGTQLADFIQINLLTPSEWDAATSTVGQWSKPPSGTIYQISQTGIGFDHGSVTGIIQTDGTIGTLTSANIVSWDLVVYDGVSNTYSLTGGAGGDSMLTITGAGLTATATQLSYNFAANGSLQIAAGSTAWELNLTSGYQTILPLGLNGNALPESGSVVLGTALAPGFFTANSFFDGQQPSSVPGWSYLQFPDGTPFGYYVFLEGSASTADSWIFHADLGYEYLEPGATAGSLFMYDLASGHWWYTASSQFPYLYDFTLNTWLYYFPNPNVLGRYSTNPRYFGNLATDTIFTM
jgi:hypothetical protein